MTSVVVRLPTVLRPFAGGVDRVAVEVAEPATVGAVFAAMEPVLRRRITDDQGGLRRHVNVFLGDDNVRDLSDLQTHVSDGDELLVLPSISGG